MKSHKITLIYSLHKNYLSNLNLYYWGPRPHFSFSTALMKSSTHTKDDLLQTRLIEFSRVVFLQGRKMEFFQILLRGKVHSTLKQYSHFSNNRGGWNKCVGVQPKGATIAKSTGLFQAIFS